MQSSLVAYKGKYAKILSLDNNKFEIEIENGKILKVREKDFRFLHPQFNTPQSNLVPDLAILLDFEGQLLNIKDLSEWLFNEYSANSSWQTFLLIEDGLYFFWQKDQIFIRPTEQVEKIQQKRKLELKEAESIQNCVDNLLAKTFQEQDLPLVKEIEKVALGQNKSAKILKKIKVESTTQAAHKLLVEIGYLSLKNNPYPTRYKILPEEDIAIPVEKTISRTDLTHLKSYAIDNKGSVDADDAISVDGEKIWIHIADIMAFMDDELIEYAGHRVSNLYLPNAIINMLPESITQICALGINKTSNALSIGFKLDNDGSIISEIEIINSTIKVTKTTYEDVDDLLNSEFSIYQNIATKHQQYRKNSGSFSLNLPKVDVKLSDEIVQISPQNSTPSRGLVAEFMILAGRVIAQFSIENNIAMPFVSQEKGNFDDELLEKKDLSLSESFASIRLFKRSITSTTPLSHFGLGLDKYIRITSPLRRYLDLIAHKQLHNFINNIDILSASQIKEYITLNNAQIGDINKATRDSNTHYKLLYLLQNKNQIFDATILSKRGDKRIIMIADLAMIETIKTDNSIDEKIKIKFKSIDIFTQQVNIEVLK